MKREEYVHDLFAREGFDLAALRRKRDSQPRPGLQDFAYPFIISTLLPQRTVHLRDVALGASQNVPLRPLQIDRRHLVFGVPKPTEQIVIAGPSMASIPSAPVATKKKRARPCDSTEPKQRKRTPAKEKSDDFPSPASSAAVEQKAAAIREESLPPQNMYQVIQQVFQEFWSLEFEDPSVTAAFFARIDSRNCMDYQLATFAHKACSLPVIQERIQDKRYASTDAFLHDFHTMFENVHAYYPESHPAVAKAYDLRKLFDTRWQSAALTLR